MLTRIDYYHCLMKSLSIIVLFAFYSLYILLYCYHHTYPLFPHVNALFQSAIKTNQRTLYMRKGMYYNKLMITVSYNEAKEQFISLFILTSTCMANSLSPIFYFILYFFIVSAGFSYFIWDFVSYSSFCYMSLAFLCFTAYLHIQIYII